METKFQTSFIPKKPIVEHRRSGSSISLFLLLSIIVFLISIGLGVWVFIQKKLLIQNITTAEQKIVEYQESFDLDSIEKMIRIDSRIKISKSLLEEHISILPIFDFLEAKTLKSVRFKTFSFSTENSGENNSNLVNVTMSGQTKDFRTVASQAEEFGKIEYRNFIKNPVFSSLQINSDSSVSFSVSMSFEPDLLSYSKLLAENQ